MNNRLELRYNFIVKNAKLFENYSKRINYLNSSHPLVKQIAEKARKVIPYSNKTIDCDIAWSMYCFYKKIKK